MTASSPEQVPSPGLVGAWEVLGILRTESVPMWTAQWLAQGLEGEGIVALASLDAHDVREVHEPLQQALRDTGVEPTAEAAAAARLTFDQIARMCLSGKASWRRVISTVTATCEQNHYASEFSEEPLGSLYGLDDDLVGGWGR